MVERVSSPAHVFPKAARYVMSFRGNYVTPASGRVLYNRAFYEFR